jgi:PAT family beta-lactamase induction signal transducer AmpG
MSSAAGLRQASNVLGGRKTPPWLRAFASWRMLSVAMLGFASGLPLALTGAALQAWMGKEGFDIKTIGAFGMVALPYALKFLWSPLMDRYVPPLLGRRRGWIMLCQLLLVAAIAAMAVNGFSGGVTLAAVLLTLIAFCSASQDIAIDAYRTDLLESGETGPGAAAAIMGWRVGFICSGAIALMLAGWLSWPTVYGLMAGCMGLTLVVTFLTPEPRTHVRPPQTFRAAVVLPLRELLGRSGAVETLLFVLIYKLDWAMVNWSAVPFLQKAMRFTDVEIGAANAWGMGVTIAGAAVGGAVLAAIGARRALWTLGILQGLAGASFALLATIGHNYTMLATAVTVENFCSGMATAAFTGFLMLLCDKRFTATQYALLSSLFALSRTAVGAPAGWLSHRAGWPVFFICSILVAVPALALLLHHRRWQMPQPPPADATPQTDATPQEQERSVASK